jgi:hypothetical protein
MATIRREASIDAPADQCWDALRDFGALHTRLARGFVTDTVLTGPRTRRVRFFTGAVATEELVGIDEDLMRLAYSVVEGPMGSSHYNAAAQIVPEGEGRCRFVWIIDVLPDQLGAALGGVMDAGIRAMKATLDADAG